MASGAQHPEPRRAVLSELGFGSGVWRAPPATKGAGLEGAGFVERHQASAQMVRPEPNLGLCSVLFAGNSVAEAKLPKELLTDLRRKLCFT